MLENPLKIQQWNVKKKRNLKRRITIDDKEGYYKDSTKKKVNKTIRQDFDIENNADSIAASAQESLNINVNKPTANRSFKML